MPIARWIKSRARLLGLAARSGTAATGPRRAAHPFIAGLRSGQVVPHQGGHWPGEAPNTIAAFRLAAPRTQILDIDIRITKDGVLVCAHDDEIDPQHRISTTEWAQLESDTRIPRLIDVVSTFPEHRLNVEVKDPRAIDAIRTLLDAEELAERTCLSTFDPVLARALCAVAPDAAHTRPTARAVGRLWGRSDVVQTMAAVPDLAPGLGRFRSVLLRVGFSAGSTNAVVRQIQLARRKGLPLFAWTVNDRASLDALIAAGADAVLSDPPDLFDEPPPAD